MSSSPGRLLGHPSSPFKTDFHPYHSLQTSLLHTALDYNDPFTHLSLCWALGSREAGPLSNLSFYPQPLTNNLHVIGAQYIVE